MASHPDDSFQPAPNSASDPAVTSNMPRWSNDRLPSAPQRSAPYTTDDYQRELKRVERRMFWLTVVSVIVALVAIAAIVGVFIQSR